MVCSARFAVAQPRAISLFVLLNAQGGNVMSRRMLFAAAAVACFVSFGARAQTVQFHATLEGASEVPPAQTQASGTATATLNRGTKILTYDITYKDLSGPPSAM